MCCVVIDQGTIKKRLESATVFQIISMALTIYLPAGHQFYNEIGNLSEYGDAISGKAVLFNILSIASVCFAAITLMAIFKAYIGVQREKANWRTT
jgi:hypothetical protein